MKFLEKLFGWGKPSMDQFARDMLTAMKAAGDTRKLAYEPDEQRLNGDGVVNLANMFAEYCQLDRADRTSFIQQVAESFVAANVDLPTDYAEAKPNLRPKVWGRSTLAFMELDARLNDTGAPEMPHYALGEHLVSTLVYDLPHSMRSLTPDVFDDWGVTYYQAMEDAVANLQADTTAWAVMGEHLHSSVTGDNYDSSRILMLPHIHSIDLQGTPIAVVPTRESLYITGEDDADGLTILMAMANDATEQDPRPLCPLPIKLVDGVWEAWRPPSNHPIYCQFVQAETQFLGELYALQKQSLDQIFEKEMNDIFVATFTGLRKEIPNEAVEGGQPLEEVVSYCVWGRGVRALLPRTQLIVLVDDSGTLASGPWDEVKAIVGDLLLEDDEYYPTRYLVDSFPTPEMLDRIGHWKELEGLQ